MTEDIQGAKMDRILQEISAVNRKLEGMDNAMVALTAETTSMRLDIAGFQSQMSVPDQRVATVETQNTVESAEQFQLQETADLKHTFLLGVSNLLRHQVEVLCHREA
ncbi:hypothetical protein NDU88_006520 [Pleurodeles waltl]|uniref:Uncharacterized protein n=1 Tax=Pleurodeles waltl TaxID=8319 RepID=A0AAV7ULQ6_PLEWA|nr:hypothetical protein NDU88_006520 [Pleurodeles waltl]